MELLYSQREFAVCLKPVGIDSEHELPAALRESLGGEIYPIHRLDRNVGGVMVFAREKAAAALLSRAVQEGTFVKEYLALVHGVPPEEGEWQDLLWKDPKANKVYRVDRPRKGVREAKLGFWRLTAGERSLVQVRLFTGRSHQIRVQFAGRGFPLVGDHKYGARDKESAPRLFSWRISFPWQGEFRRFEALPEWEELGEDFSGFKIV